ncbi:MAG: hypothetical protein GX864_02135 [Mollicutes bacterium]|nr:hypothetical protein [Mollicutes bacterium]
MKETLVFLSIFLFIFFAYILYGFIKIKNNSYLKMSEYRILVNRYKVDPKKYPFKNLKYIIAFANSFIITNTVMVTSLIKTSNYIWMILLAVFTIMILIVTVYTIIGKIIGKKK